MTSVQMPWLGSGLGGEAATWQVRGGSGGWALGLGTDSAFWDRGHWSPLELGRKPALGWVSKGPGQMTEQ